MTLKQILLAAGLALVAGPAAADCADRITFLEEVLDDAARLAMSASSGGQGVAGARVSVAMTEEGTEEPVPYQDEADAEEAVEDTEEAGDGGDALIEARAQLGEARNLAEDGDEEACTTQVREILVGLIQD
ncbi:hypothetical protein FA743_13085 [Paracoccus gahaiensis]|uniref:Uncharacterized protein n=1 Tax=Paracoccus gahaiensis TaxID=1706839 RepID=A0A4U0R778_9RHOB|nr:hypothetical protein [Paracoccus gahaiensis]TJZ90839.1 hypothetical protein FA743_13085 [Paracoccus gahaiensis]